MKALDLPERIGFAELGNLLVTFGLECLHQGVCCWLPLAGDETNVPLFIFLPGHIPKMPAPIQKTVVVFIHLHRERTLPKRSEVVIRFFGSPVKPGQRVIHRPALSFLHPLEPALYLGFFLHLMSTNRVKPRPSGRTEHRGELIPQVPTTPHRVAGHQVRGKVRPETALHCEVGTLDVEVIRNLLMQRIERGLLLKQALSQIADSFDIHLSLQASRPQARS